MQCTTQIVYGLEVLHNDTAVPDNTNYSNEQNKTQRKIIANNINSFMREDVII